MKFSLLIKVKKVLSILDPYQINKLKTLMLLVVGMALAETISLTALLPILDSLSKTNFQPSSNFFHFTLQQIGIQTSLQFQIFSAAVALVVLFCSAMYRTFVMRRLVFFTQHQIYDISTRLLSIFFKRDYDWFFAKNTSKLSKIILSDVQSTVKTVIVPLMLIISQSFVSLGIIIFLFVVEPTLTILSFIVLGILYLTIYKTLSNKVERMGKLKVLANRERFKLVNEAFNGIKTVKASCLEEKILRNYEKSSSVFVRQQANQQTLELFPRYLIEFLASIAIILVFVVSSLISSSKEEFFAKLMLFGFALFKLLPAFQQMYVQFSKLKYGSQSLEEILEEYDGQFSYLLNKSKQSYSQSLFSSDPNQTSLLRLENISYAYGTSAGSVSELSIDIKREESIGICGSSGSGKTTFLDICAGLLHPTSGSIFVAGSPVSIFNNKNWKSNIGYVTQDTFAFDGTIKENIVWNSDIDDDEWLSDVIEMVGLSSVVYTQLPLGISTNIGERGICLSGGQLQRIGLARAIYKKPKLLLLDEATSALDLNTESVISTNISALSCTKILVAHRLTTLKYCDKILVFNGGKLTESGTFNSLLCNSHLFQDLYYGRDKNE